MVYIIGDSHVSIFSGIDTGLDGNIHIQPEWDYCYRIVNGEMIDLRPHNPFIKMFDNITSIKMGSNTAYNLYNKLDKIKDIINGYNITKDDIILFCYGEIDIRAHIGFHADENNLPIKISIDICVDRYLEVLLHFKELGFNVGVFAPSASLPNELFYNVGRNYKDSQTRNRITFEFNKYLNDKCLEHGLIFKNIQEKLLNDDYSSNKIYFKDNIHLSKEALPFIIEELKDII